MTEDLKTVESKVSKLLEELPMLRSCDRMLIATYMKRYHGIETFRQYALCRPKPPSVESIRRVRQKIQELGMFKSNDQTKALRDNAIEEYRRYATDKDRQMSLL